MNRVIKKNLELMASDEKGGLIYSMGKFFAFWQTNERGETRLLQDIPFYFSARSGEIKSIGPYQDATKWVRFWYPEGTFRVLSCPNPGEACRDSWVNKRVESIEVYTELCFGESTKVLRDTVSLYMLMRAYRVGIDGILQDSKVSRNDAVEVLKKTVSFY